MELCWVNFNIVSWLRCTRAGGAPQKHALTRMIRWASAVTLVLPGRGVRIQMCLRKGPFRAMEIQRHFVPGKYL